ncbi:MAG: hypothetical protein H6548_05730 [Chitinophagales bacterium]|nr:hypothetical protein [Chitinophagales bacterium]HAE12776.1 hypothetical protein [Bacteroidota bacterium]MCB9021598.1 hypothetical protein [Chitinophagales bacterium]MCB9031149.1 hypothetical protein [Chitinophagales bacterium]HAE35686.1 hypothetical protein [Bacteroidota bacterium]
MTGKGLSWRDRIFWACVGIISIVSVYFVSRYLISGNSEYAGFDKHTFHDQYEIYTPPYLLPDDSLNSAAILRFSDFSNEVFIMVLEEKKRDLDRRGIHPVLAEYFLYIQQNLMEKLDSPVIVSQNDHFLHGLHAIQCELEGMYDSIPVYYIFSTYETEQSFLQVRGWTETALKPAVKQDLFASIRSFAPVVKDK